MCGTVLKSSRMTCTPIQGAPLSAKLRQMEAINCGPTVVKRFLGVGVIECPAQYLPPFFRMFTVLYYSSIDTHVSERSNAATKQRETPPSKEVRELALSNVGFLFREHCCQLFGTRLVTVASKLMGVPIHFKRQAD